MPGARIELHRNDIELGFVTHVGMVRTENQDSYGFFEPEGDEEFRGKGRLVVVCDGMGGHYGGSIASNTTVDSMLAAATDTSLTNPKDLLSFVINEANQHVRDKGREDPELSAMGTTCVAFVARGSQLEVAHVGDSRAYRFHGAECEQITRDHTYLNDLIDIGLLTPELAKNHPERNIITRCVGMSDELQIEFNSREIEVGDAFLLCSDGLFNHVEDEEMQQMVASMDAQPACQALVDLANKRGGDDNITVAILKVKTIPSLFDDLEPDEDRKQIPDEDDSSPGPSGASTPVLPLQQLAAAEAMAPAAVWKGRRNLGLLIGVELLLLIILQLLIRRF